jgi:hypothetical protein
MEIMGPEGHAEISWDMDDPESVEDAEQMFKDLLDKGYQAFEVSHISGNPGKGRRVRKFDPYLESIVMIPPVAGG